VSKYPWIGGPIIDVERVGEREKKIMMYMLLSRFVVMVTGLQ